MQGTAKDTANSILADSLAGMDIPNSNDHHSRQCGTLGALDRGFKFMESEVTDEEKEVLLTQAAVLLGF